MIEYKSINSLTFGEAKVLLDPIHCQNLFFVDLRELEEAEDVPLVEVLATPHRSAQFWQSYLSGLYVALFDVNRVDKDKLERVPGLSSEQIDLLINARPYFSLADLREEGDELAEVAHKADSYLAHEGYVFIDKPRGRLVEFIPNQAGIIARYRAGQDVETIRLILQAAGLRAIYSDTQERLLVCKWEIDLSERPLQLHTFKQHESIETVSPVLEDFSGQQRLSYPDRLDLSLRHDADVMQWEQLISKYNLSEVQKYNSIYGSVRIDAHPHDLGALYRSLRTLIQEPIVSYVEPTYLVNNEV